MEPSLHTHRFSNGIRLIHRENRSEVAHFGLLVQTGTRDEETDEHGMAHFMEHMFFKGTRKRSAYQIISRLEDVGGEINAYTTKEETSLYASFMKEDYRRAMELIQDIFMHSEFREEDRVREAEVILNEIQAYDDTPSELIFDHAEELLFPEHPIGRNILGSETSLARFRNGTLERFLRENYATGEIVLTSVGSVPFERIRRLAERYFSEIPLKPRTRVRAIPRAANGLKVVEERNTVQTHCMLVGEGYALTDPRRLRLYLLNNILGGPGMNSRLNMALRERKGYTYNVESHYAPYGDTGAMMVYFSCDHDTFSRALQTTREEIRKLRNKQIPEQRMVHARKQLLGQLAISSENNENLMLTTGKSYLVFNDVDSLRDIWHKLETITAADLLETANEIFRKENLNQLVFR